MSVFKINSTIDKDELENFSEDDFSFIEFVHPQIIRLLKNAKLNERPTSNTAYYRQIEVSFKCVSSIKFKENILLNKKAS